MSCGSQLGLEGPVLLLHARLEIGGERGELALQGFVGGGEDLHGEEPALRAPSDRYGRDRNPAGIWTIESSESSPSRRARGTGTPTTGRVVTAASMPGQVSGPAGRRR